MLLGTLGVGLLVGSFFTSLSSFAPASLKLANTITAAFRTLNLGIKHGEILVTPTVNAEITYKWGSRLLCAIPIGLSSKRVIEQRQAISEALRCDVDVYWQNGLIIDVYRIPMEENVPFDLAPRNDHRIAIGINRRFEIRYFDFAGSFPHLLIGGISGGGKSVLLRSILTQLATGPKPDLWLCDMKGGVELNLFRDLAVTKRFAVTLSEVANAASEVVAEMERRYTTMERSGSQQWQGKRLIFVMDELADLKARAKDSDVVIKNAIKTRLTALSAKGRAAGVFILLCTQRPSVDVVDGLIKTNIATSVCFRTRDGTQSRIILDNTDAADLPDIPGRCIFQQAKDETLQTHFLSYEQAVKILATCERKAVTPHEPAKIPVNEVIPVESNLAELG